MGSEQRVGTAELATVAKLNCSQQSMAGQVWELPTSQHLKHHHLGRKVRWQLI